MVETIYTLPSCPVHLALLADFHNGDPQPILSSLNRHRPDLIAIAGDLIYGSQPRSLDPNSEPELVIKSQVNVLPLLTGCASIAPTFISLGNHEWMLNSEDLQLIKSTGAVVLDNRWEHPHVHQNNRGYYQTNRENLNNLENKICSDITIGGLSSGYVEHYRRFLSSIPTSVKQKHRYITDAVIRECGMKIDDEFEDKNTHTPDTSCLGRLPRGYKILLCHHPEYINKIPESIQLVLSGHAHGGQWRFYDPIHRTWRGVFAPGQGLFPKLTEGVHGRHVISRGLNNTTWIPRFFNEPEIVYIRGG